MYSQQRVIWRELGSILLKLLAAATLLWQLGCSMKGIAEPESCNPPYLGDFNGEGGEVYAGVCVTPTPRIP